MTSSKLSGRRATAQKPHVCHPPPTPVPPPPPPPPPWPPDTTDVHAVLDWTYAGQPGHVDLIVTCNRQGTQWYWYGTTESGLGYLAVSLIVNTEAQTMQVTIEWFGPPSMAMAQKNALALTWGVQTDYLITTWDTVWPPSLTASAEFTF